MRKLCSVILCLLIIISMLIPVFAATSVPDPVMKGKNSVVRVLAEYPDGYATGSAFVVVSDSVQTILVTNYHVVEGKPYSISVWIGEEERVRAGIVNYSEQKDLCILRLEYPVSLPALPLSKNGAAQGDAVYAVGFPSAADVLSDKEAHTSEAATITDGIVSAIREVTISEYGSPVAILQISAAINAGNSGGPSFNEKGEVVGVNTYGIIDAQGIFGAIDVQEVALFLKDNGIVLPLHIGALLWVLLAVLAIAATAGIFLAIRNKTKNTAGGRYKKEISLREYMENNPDGLDVSCTVDLLLPVAVQLRDLHSVGACHLQVSPDTVLISKKGVYLKKATTEEFSRYTSGYAALEVYKGTPASILSDIYSFSALLYYVSSGKHPENAMTRAESCDEEVWLQSKDDAFTAILLKGLSLDGQSRFTSMQELIVRLLPFKTDLSSSSVAIKHVKDNHSASHHKVIVSKKRVAVITLSVLIGLQLVGGVGACVSAICDQYFIADKMLIVSPLTRFAAGKLTDYIEAGQMMAQRNYTAAKEIYSSLPGFLNADALSQDADYQYVLQCADRNDFSTAIQIMEELESNGYPDAYQKAQQLQYRYGTYLLYEEKNYKASYDVFSALIEQEYPGAQAMANDVQYVWALDLVDQGEYRNAYLKLSAIRDYFDVEESLESLTRIMYSEGRTKYRAGKYKEAKELFSCIGNYENVSKYLTLIKVRTNNFFTKSDANALIKIFNFEDAAELILSNQTLAEVFLEGKWLGDGHYFTMREDGSISYSLPRINYGYYYRIEDGYILLYPENNYNDTKKCFRISAITPDSIKIYCFQNKRTYTLNRQ